MMNADYNVLSYLVYRVLLEKSNPARPLRQQDILDNIADVYGLTPSRVTLSHTLHQMADYGCPVCGLDGRKGVWLQPECDETELRMLTDPLLSASHISNSNLDKLLGSLGKLGAKNREYYAKSRKAAHHYWHHNEDIVNTIHLVAGAVGQKCVLQFIYCDFDEQHRMIPRRDKDHPEGKRQVSAYGIVYMDGHYYMVASEHKPQLRNYRIDKMTGLMLTGEKALPLEQITGQKFFDPAAYGAMQNYKMFGGELVEVKYRIHMAKPEEKIKFINIVWDEFGNRPYAFDTSGKNSFTFKVKIPKLGAKIFARQYSEVAELLEPRELRQELGAEYVDVAAKYQK